METAQYTDKELITNILAGNLELYKEFIEKYKNLVAHISFRIIPNEVDREDVCQDVFVKIYKNLPKFNFGCKLSTWVSKITYNTCLNHVEKMKTPLIEDDLPKELTISDYKSEAMTPLDIMERSNVSYVVRKEVEKLPLNYKLALTLYHLDNISYREIAEILDMPEGTVKSYIFRARKLLKDKLEGTFSKEIAV